MKSNRKHRKELALLLGWRYEHMLSHGPSAYEGTHGGYAWIPPGIDWNGLEWWEQRGLYEAAPPDYPNDLNAVHDTVQGLDREIRKQYRETLALRHGELAVDATARQRTEALIWVLARTEEKP